MTEKLNSTLNPSQFNNYKIIIVEDDEGLAHLIQKKLKQKGFQTDTAGSGEKALQVIKGLPDEILLIDYKLPDISGKELVKKLIEKHGSKLCFLVMTGFGDEKIAVEMMKLGAKSYIVKDADFIDILLEQIKLVINDLNQQKELETVKASLEASKQDFQVLFETMAEGVLYQDETGKVISANPAAEQILGLTIDQLTGKTLMNPRWKAVDEHYNELPVENQPAMVALKTGKRVQNFLMGVFNPQKNGYVWILVNAVPQFREEETKPYQVYTTFSDITERKNAEEKIKSSEERLKILFEYAPNAIFLKDMEGKFIDGNRAVEKLLGYSREQLVNQSLVSPQFIVEKDLEKAFNIIKLNAQGKGSEFVQLDLKHKNGSIVSTEVKTYPVSINGKKLILGIAHDITEHKKAISALEQSEEKYRNIFENIQDTYYEVTLDGVILEVSPSVEKLSNGQIKRADLFGQSLLPYYKYPEQRNRFLNELQEKGFINNFELELQNKDGSAISCSFSSKLITDETGKPTKIVGSIRDITDRKKAEEEINRAEKKFRSLIENAPDGVVIINADGIMTYGSPNAFRHFGYKKDEIIGHSGAEFTHPDDMPEIASVFEKLFSNPSEKVSAKYRFRHKNGEYRWIETTFTNLLHDEAVQGIVLNFSDITERKKTISALEQSEERYRNIFENMQDVYYEVNSQGIITEMSPSIHYFSLGQYKREELIGREVTSLYKNPEERNGFLSQIHKNGFIHDYELTFLNKDGSEIICSVTARVQVNKNGEPEKIVGNLHNITDRKKMEAELVNAKEKAEESDRLKSAFLANMSHEIRTPMNGILGFASLLKEPDINGEERSNFINIIQNSGKRMLQTVNDLIDISRIETGQVKLELSNINVKKEVVELYHFFEAEAKKKGLKLLISDELEKLETETKTDGSKFTSVLSNLIKNAVKYTPKGHVRIGCKQETDHLVFFVEDTGIGIPESKLNTIFDRFVQVEAGYTRNYEGAGLGLSIAKAYAEILGGKIWAESEINKGSVFYFSLPLNPVHNNQKANSSSMADSFADTNRKRLKILIVEDDATSRLHLQYLLKSYAKELLFAHTGKEAVAYCRKREDLDLILMDIKMPVMDGYEAARKIRMFNKEVTIIAQTAYAMSGDRKKAIEAGCDDYITKPIDKKRLLEKISQYTKQKTLL